MHMLFGAGTTRGPSACTPSAWRRGRRSAQCCSATGTLAAGSVRLTCQAAFQQGTWQQLYTAGRTTRILKGLHGVPCVAAELDRKYENAGDAWAMGRLRRFALSQLPG